MSFPIALLLIFLRQDLSMNLQLIDLPRLLMMSPNSRPAPRPPLLSSGPQTERARSIRTV